MSRALDAARVLVVEDETMVSMDIVLALEDMGAQVLETGTLSGAVELARGEEFDGAILDIDLRGEAVFPAADILQARSVPIVFHTGHGERADLQQRYPGARVCIKPTMMTELLAQLGDAMRHG